MEEKLDYITGDKIKKYLIVTCPECGESFRIDFAKFLYTHVGVSMVCPWCDHEEASTTFVDLHKLEFQYVKEG